MCDYSLDWQRCHSLDSLWTPFTDWQSQGRPPATLLSEEGQDYVASIVCQTMKSDFPRMVPLAFVIVAGAARAAQPDHQIDSRSEVSQQRALVEGWGATCPG